MALPDIFSRTESDRMIGRIQNLNPQSTPLWGKMNVGQMLAHLNVSYEMVFTDKHPKPGAFMRFLLKSMVKNKVVSEQPYKRNGPTAPAFIQKGDKDFESEKKRLVDYINQVQQLGAQHFDGKESHSFGTLNREQWNNMFQKHLEHHLSQFGV